MSSPTTTFTPAAPAVCIKLELRFSNGSPSVYHRFTQGFESVEELKSLCIKLWKQAQQQFTSSSDADSKESCRLALRYSDDEGDQVIISTQHEWDECVRIYHENKFNVLRLNVANEEEDKRNKKKNSQIKREHAASSDKKETSAEELLSSAADGFFSMLFGGGRAPRSTTAVSSSHLGCCAPPMKRWGCSRPDLSEVKAVQEKRQKAVSNLLSILFNGEEKKEDGVSSTLPLGGASYVNLFQLYQEAVAAGNHLMDAGCLEEAGRLLAAALEVFPSDKVHLYNLACVRSLEGSVDEALKLLLEAKKNGYNNLAHAAVDPDLENLRRSAEFATQFFVEFLGQQRKRNNTTQVESPTPTTTPAAKNNAGENTENDASEEDDDVKSAKTAVSASPSSSGASTTTNGNPDAVALVNMFPNLSFAEAENTLEKFNGDLSAAVNLLLE